MVAHRGGHGGGGRRWIWARGGVGSDQAIAEEEERKIWGMFGPVETMACGPRSPGCMEVEVE